ncbi:hypothetical protein D3C71_190190 [compost metagenome]
MQIMFLMAFALLIITIAGIGTNRIDRSETLEPRTAAAHMAVYHNAAVTLCRETACSSGIISAGSVKTRVTDSIADGPLFAKQFFISNYDAPSKTVVTYMKPGFALRGSINYATVNVGLRDLEGADSSSFGRWDASSKKIIPSYVYGYAVNYKVPSAIASVLFDGTPVIVNRL